MVGASPGNSITADYKDRLFRHRRRDLVLWSTMMLILFITCNAITKIPLLSLDIHYTNAWISDLLLTIGLIYFILRYYHYRDSEHTKTVHRPENTKLGYIREELCHLHMLEIIEADYDNEVRDIISKLEYRYSKQTINTTTFYFFERNFTYSNDEGNKLLNKISKYREQQKTNKATKGLITDHNLDFKISHDNLKIHINFIFAYTARNSKIRPKSNFILIFRAFKHRFWFELHFPFYYAFIVVILYIFRIISDFTNPYCYFC